MIDLIKHLWRKWRNRKYIKRLKEQSEYYSQLARSLNKAYYELSEKIDTENMYVEIPLDFLESEIPELKGDMEVQDMLHQPVKINELYINGVKIK